MLIDLECPNCGAPFLADEAEARGGTCPFCMESVTIPSTQSPLARFFDVMDEDDEDEEDDESEAAGEPAYTVVDGAPASGHVLEPSALAAAAPIGLAVHVRQLERSIRVTWALMAVLACLIGVLWIRPS